MTYYIDTENSDMNQLAFEQIKGNDLPVWKDVQSPDEIEVKRISGAMTNIIFKVTVKGKKCQPLLFRAYGCSTDLFFNRDEELYYFQKLSDENFGISLLKSFPGGRLEVWREGYDPLLAPQMREDEISDKIAAKLASMHNIKLDSYDKEEYFKHYYYWAEGIKNSCTKDVFKNVRLDLILPEIDNLKLLITADDYEVVFGHHDLQHGNILMNQEGDIMFVDFEYSGPISVGVDIANHFCEWMTDYNLPDSEVLRESLGPTEEQQRRFIRSYLRARFGKEPTEEEVDKLKETVRKHTLLTDFHWFLWGLLQKQMSTIDWDYWKYTQGRWNRYAQGKKEIYGVDALPIMP